MGEKGKLADVISDAFIDMKATTNAEGGIVQNDKKPPDDADDKKPPDGSDNKPPDDAGDTKPPDNGDDKPPDDGGDKDDTLDMSSFEMLMGKGEDDAGSGDDGDTKPPEGDDKPPDDAGDNGDKSYRALAAMRVQLKEANTKLKSYEEGGGEIAELREQMAVQDKIIQRKDFQKSAKFIREYKKPVDDAVAEVRDLAKDLGVDGKVVTAALSMNVGARLKYLDKNVENQTAKVMLLQGLSTAQKLYTKAMSAVEKAEELNKSAQEEESMSVINKLNETREEMFSKVMKDFEKDESIGMVLRKFDGDDDDKKTWNYGVDRRVKTAHEVLYSDDPKAQVAAMIKGSLANDTVAMAKQWYDKYVEVRDKLAAIHKRKGGLSAGGDIKNGANKQEYKGLDNMAANVTANLGKRK